MIRTRSLTQATLLALALTACGGGRYESDGVTPSGSAELRVENDNTSDMRIYVIPNSGGARFRVGTANGLQVTTLKIPRTLVTGVTDLTFEIVPIGGGRPSFSQKITANPGEQIVLRISP